MQVKGGLSTVLRILAAVPEAVVRINVILVDKRVTGSELIGFGVWLVETIAGKTLDELGIVVDFG